eukprot:scaffold65725_cov30-Phaeocystis_antarctica.AAC.1
MIDEVGPSSRIPDSQMLCHIVTLCVVGGHYPLRARSPSVLVHSRLRRPGLIAVATKSMDVFDLVSKERVNR